MSEKKKTETAKPQGLSQIRGLSQDFARKLERRGITSVEALAIMSLNDLKELGLDETTAKTVLREAWAKVGFGIITADQIDKLYPRDCFTTGCKALDELLGGGVYTRDIMELTGDYGSGKTQTMLTILTETLGQHPDYGAIFLDSEQTFKTQRLKEIVKARGYNPEDIIKRLRIIMAPATEQFLLSVNEMPRVIKEHNVKLIMLDSLIGPFRSEYVGRELLWYRQQLINQLLRKLLNYASIFNLAVVVSNQVVATPQTVYGGDIVKEHPPTGGHIVGHGCNTRVYLRSAGRTKRIARLFDSSWRPEGECVFCISPKGIEDSEEET